MDWLESLSKRYLVINKKGEIEMKKFIDNFYLRGLNEERYPSDIKFDISLTKTDDINPTPSWNPERRYELLARVGAEFWCTREGLDACAAQAEEQILHEVFKEPLSILYRLRSLVHQGDKGLAMAEIGRLLDYFTGR